MKLFEDKELTKEIAILEGKPQLDLSIVEAGESKKYSFYIVNDHPYAEIHDLQLVVDNKEVSIIKHPSKLGLNESGEFEIEWKADISIERGIRPNFKFKYNLICS